MIYVTGDTHGGFDIDKLFNIPFLPDDILIICGDFGFVWQRDYTQIAFERKKLDLLLNALNCTVLFVDGNHENFPRLNSLPREEKFGAEVGVVRDRCYHLLRGNVYTINGKKFLAIGGAESHDMKYRTEGINWWREESITEEEIEKAKKAGEVDFVISHCVPDNIKERMCLEGLLPLEYILSSISETRLGKLAEEIKFDYWFCGHYHMNVILGDFIILYDGFIKIGEDGNVIKDSYECNWC